MCYYVGGGNTNDEGRNTSVELASTPNVTLPAIASEASDPEEPCELALSSNDDECRAAGVAMGVGGATDEAVRARERKEPDPTRRRRASEAASVFNSVYAS